MDGRFDLSVFNVADDTKVLFVEIKMAGLEKPITYRHPIIDTFMMQGDNSFLHYKRVTVTMQGDRFDPLLFP